MTHQLRAGGSRETEREIAPPCFANNHVVIVSAISSVIDELSSDEPLSSKMAEDFPVILSDPRNNNIVAREVWKNPAECSVRAQKTRGHVLNCHTPCDNCVNVLFFLRFVQTRLIRGDLSAGFESPGIFPTRRVPGDVFGAAS